MEGNRGGRGRGRDYGEGAMRWRDRMKEGFTPTLALSYIRQVTY